MLEGAYCGQPRIDPGDQEKSSFSRLFYRNGRAGYKKSMLNSFLGDLAKDLGLSLESSEQVSGYQIDSRFVKPGNLFFALPGEVCDGHDFLKEVAKKGALGAVVARGTPAVEGLILLEVEDVQEALEILALKGLERKRPSFLAITGSVGKTTAKEFAATLLEGTFRVAKSPASYNSKLTVPLNLLNREGQEEIFVLEMGMSKPNEIERLTRIATPDIALLTKVALVHAMNFPEGLSAIAKAKAEIFSQPATQVAILDFECLNYPEIVEAVHGKTITFSTKDPSADYYLFSVGDQFAIDEKGVRVFQGQLPFCQEPLLHNLLAAMVAARNFGMKWEEIERQLPKLVLPKMRFEIVEKGGVKIVNDAYNASPISMRAALENLPQPQEGGKTIAVLGSMKELGSFSKEAHREVGILAQKYVDWLFCLGEETQELCDAFSLSKKPFEHFLEKEALVARLKEIVRPSDVVLLKGSRSLRLEEVLERFVHVTVIG